MLEKTNYLFPIVSLFYLAVFYFSLKIKIAKRNKLKVLNKKIKKFTYLLEVTDGLNLLCLLISVLLIFLIKVFTNYSSNNINSLFNSEIITFSGYLLVKFSLAWIIISEYEVHKYLDDHNANISAIKIFKVELISVLSVFIFTIGSAFALSSNVLFFTSLIPLTLMIIYFLLIILGTGNNQ